MKETRRRRKGEGSITKLQNGEYRGRITINGVTKTCCARSEAKVKAQLKQFRDTVLRGDVAAKKIRLQDYMQDWLVLFKQPAIKESSYDRLERTFNAHIKNTEIGRAQLGSIQSKSLQAYINRKSQAYSYSTVKKIYEILKACLKHAVLVRDLGQNPMDAVVMPNQANMPIKTKKIKGLTEEECRRFIKVLLEKDEDNRPIYRYAYAFLLDMNTGLRCGELQGLRWEDVDWENRLLHIRNNVVTVKNRKDDEKKKYVTKISSLKTSNGYRCIHLNDMAMETLSALRQFYHEENTQSPYVICTKTGEIVTHNNLQRCLDRILKKAGIQHVGLHSLRHTFASLVAENTNNLKLVSELLGHADTRMAAKVYVHTSDSQMKKALDELNYIRENQVCY